ncbi:hypothetical protein KCU77_g3342, partial [Aureobasidium melanogenum]
MHTTSLSYLIILTPQWPAHESSMMHIRSILTIAVLGWGMCEATSPTYGNRLDARGYEFTKGQVSEFSNYSSAIEHHVGHGFNPVTCFKNARPRAVIGPGPATAQWAVEHNNEWKRWTLWTSTGNLLGQGRQRDEWPPAHFWQGDLGQVIRYNHREDNAGAAQLRRSHPPQSKPL